MRLYENMAGCLESRIREGIYPPGSRLPGVRALASQFSVSISTAIAALRLLEDDGWIEGRERSGFFVLHQRQPLTRTAPGPESGEPAAVSSQSTTLALLQASASARFGRLGVAMPDPSYLPVAPLQRAFRQAARWRRGEPVDYSFPPGLRPLRVQVARRLAQAGCIAGPDRVVITSGAQEAISLSLKVLTEPGDIVVTESPTYYGLLQCLETLNLKVIEVPTHPRDGISIPALRLALEQWPVKACVLVPNHANPLGFAMREDAKRALAALLDDSGVALVEDDVYGELGHRHGRPRTVQSYMQGGNWFLAGSSSKTIAAGLRLGWVVAPAIRQPRLEYLQYTYDAGVSTLDQYALADYLSRGSLNRHLRQVRCRYAASIRRMTELVEHHFPPGTSVNPPAGGYVLWVTCPPELDTLTLYQRALARGIAITPGILFSATGRFGNCFRLNAAVSWNAELEAALAELGAMAGRLLEESAAGGRSRLQAAGGG